MSKRRGSALSRKSNDETSDLDTRSSAISITSKSKRVPNSKKRKGSKTGPRRYSTPIADEELNEYQAKLKLQKCKFCKRHFFPDRISFHQHICGAATKSDKQWRKMVEQKDKMSDKQGFGNVKTKVIPPGFPSWRNQQNFFIESIRASENYGLQRSNIGEPLIIELIGVTAGPAPVVTNDTPFPRPMGTARPATFVPVIEYIEL